MADMYPHADEILAAIGRKISPDELITSLSEGHDTDGVIEGLQRAIEREVIMLDSAGMVVPTLPVVTLHL